MIKKRNRKRITHPLQAEEYSIHNEEIKKLDSLIEKTEAQSAVDHRLEGQNNNEMKGKSRKEVVYRSAIEQRRNARLTIYGELIFLILPFIVTSYLLIGKPGGISTVFLRSDLSLAATIINGQALIRFLTGLIKIRGGQPIWQMSQLYAGILFVLVVISAVNYAAIEISPDANKYVYLWAQIPLFVISLLIFVTFGGIGESLLNRED